MHKAGRVEQDVDGAGALGNHGDSIAVAHVEPRHFRDAVLAEQRQTLLVDIGGKHRGAFTRKGNSASPANSHGARGHERALALESV